MEHYLARPPARQAQSDAPAVSRIVYASQSNVQGSIYAEMERIRASAVRHNEPVGLATALLHQSGWFVQWKEGPKEALEAIMGRVAQDRRHHSLRIVHSSHGPRLLDGPWSMAIVQCADPPGDMEQRVDKLRDDLERGRQYSPPAVWRRLSTPMRHPKAAQQGEPDAFQRVLVCAAVRMASFTLVEWLARHHWEEVVHRRFAGARDLDVGTDYVDFAEGGRVLRVIAMARHGLAVPLTRAFLPDYSHIVLLLSGEQEHDLALLERVAEGCASLVSPPLLLGLAQDNSVHHDMFALAHRRGLIYLDAQGNIEDGRACWEAIAPQLAAWRHSANTSVWPVAPLRFG